MRILHSGNEVCRDCASAAIAYFDYQRRNTASQPETHRKQRVAFERGYYGFCY